jgi:hypothetical protein
MRTELSIPGALLLLLVVVIPGSSTRAQRVPLDTVTFAAVSVGGIHTCGLAAGGVAYCWGWNTRGQLGDGTSGTERWVPVRVVGDARFAAVSAGDRYSCGLTAAGAAYCWGLNGWGLNVQGQLGDGTTESRRRPVPVAGDIRFVAIEAGGSGQALGFHSCGLTAAGAPYCWGQNARGQLGDGTTQDRTRPVPVAQNRAGAAIPPPLEGEAAYVDAMKADLRNLVVAEEVFFADSVKYSSKIEPGAVDLLLSEGSTLLSLQLTQNGWTARIGHAYTQTVCTIFVGSTPLPPATKEGVPACR